LPNPYRGLTTIGQARGPAPTPAFGGRVVIDLLKAKARRRHVVEDLE
jgi:hypothetical protein